VTQSCLYDPITENLAHTLISGFDPDDESVPGILARSSIEEVEADKFFKQQVCLII